MGNAINNTGNQASNANQLSDMLSRMASGKQGNESGSDSFARLMSQQQGAQPGSLAAAQATRPAPLPTSVRPPAANAMPTFGGARMQATRGSTPSASQEPERASSAQSTRQEARSVKPRNEAAPKQASRQPSSSQAKPADESQDAQRSDATTRADLTEGKAEEATRFTTALGEGSAEVRELTPPTNVQPNDSASMMAWLVSLTQQGGAPTLPAEGSVDGDASGEGVALEGDAGLTLVQDTDKGDKGRGRGLALGWSLGQRDLGLDTRAAASSSAAALQVDAMLGRAAPAGQDSDPLAAMMSADGARASFGHTLSQATAPRQEQASIPVPLDAPDFSQKLADQVSLWVGQVKQDGPMTAELHLNPAEMGPINVKISLDGTAAQVDFAAAAQETRQAIEASLSMLSSALSDAGLSLSGGGVSSQTPQQTLAQGGNPGQDGRSGRGSDGRVDQDDDGDAVEAGGLRQVSAPRTSRLGGLDLYA